jgi:CheY-like chemotaxis protein
VEDDADSRWLVTALLEAEGARVVEAESASAALTALEREVPDVLISDIGMPGIDGYELIRRVRGHPVHRRLPAVALTAYAGDADRTRALTAGFQFHLPKPVEPGVLVEALVRLLRLGSKP